jgi:hypothetical protein
VERTLRGKQHLPRKKAQKKIERGRSALFSPSLSPSLDRNLAEHGVWIRILPWYEISAPPRSSLCNFF